MKVLPIPCSFDNYSYLMICPATGEAAVVDPTEAYPVMAAVEENNVKLTTVLCTHHHQDHIGDIPMLQERLSELEVVCHVSDKNRIAQATGYVDDGDAVQVGELQGRVLATPGHTTGSICYHFNEHLFSGDTLFGAGCGRLFEGTPAQMYSSLNDRIALLPEATRIYFGHEYTSKNLAFAQTVEPGNENIEEYRTRVGDGGVTSTPTTLQLEKLVNPFLRCDSEEIKKTVRERGGSTDDPREVFAFLRQLRNDF